MHVGAPDGAVVLVTGGAGGIGQAINRRLADSGWHVHAGDLPQALELTLAPERAPLVASATIAAGARLYALAPRRASLEQLFLDIVGTEDSGQ